MSGRGVLAGATPGRDAGRRGAAALTADEAAATPATEASHEVRLRARAPGLALEFLEPDPAGRPRWLPLAARLELGDDGRPRAVHAERDASGTSRARLLARGLRLLDAPLDLESTVWEVAELLVCDLADWCLVEVVGSDLTRRCALAHAEPEQADVAQRLRHPAMMGRLLTLMRRLPSMTVVDLEPPDLPGSGARTRRMLADLDAVTAVTVPLTAAGRPVGSMLLLGCGGRRLTGADVELAAELGRRAGSASDKARLHDELKESTRVLQQSLLPPSLPTVPGVRLSAHHRSGTSGSDISGDYYDVFRSAPGRWWVALGDVCGKGPAAAALSSAVRHLLHALAHDTDDPAVVLRRLNDVLLGEEWDGRFTTLSLLTFVDDPGTGPLTLRVASGGHPAPLVRDAEGSVRAVSCPGTLVGAVPELAVATVPVVLGPGETLVLYTDGVTEARDPCGIELGEATLTMLLAARHGRPVEDLAGELAFEVLKLVDGELRDDLALLTLTR